jgi:hypothetical protein
VGISRRSNDVVVLWSWDGGSLRELTIFCFRLSPSSESLIEIDYRPTHRPAVTCIRSSMYVKFARSHDRRLTIKTRIIICKV